MSAQQAETVEFKVVHKRSSNQGRRLERPPHSSNRVQHSHTSHSDETNSTRKRTPLHQQKDKGDREVRLRPQTHRSSGSSRGEANRSSSSGSSRDKEDHSYHHSHSRHRSSNSNSLDSDSGKGNSKVDKITSPNRFEKLEKLDPDVDIDNESSSSAKSSRSSDNDRKRAVSNHKSSKSGSHHRKGLRDSDATKSGRDKGHALNKSSTNSNESQQVIGKDAIKENGGREVHTNGDINRSNSTSLESSELSTRSTSDSFDLSKEELSIADTKESESELSTFELTSIPGDDSHVVEERKDSNRISYTRDELIALRSQPLSLYRPKQLDSCDACILKAPPPGSSTNENRLATEDETESATPEGGKVTKHPTALTLIREYGDNKLLGKVSLSPQRRSFHSGCSWTTPGSTNTSNSEAPPSTPPSTKNGSYSEKRDGQHFDFEGSVHQSASGQKPSSTHSGNYQGPPTPSGRVHSHHTAHAPRVIDHIPLMDQEQQRHKKSWRERNRDSDWRRGSNNHYQSREEEPEPEWMEFGPTDRFDVIELKGMEEHEREREARKQPDSQPGDAGDQSDKFEEFDSENPLKLGGGDQGVTESENCERSETVTSPLETEEATREEKDTHHQRQQLPRGERREEMDEYMLEGFDFSTGVSICKELDLDEEEGEVKGELFSSTVETPSQLSNALMRALKVGGQEQKRNKQEMRSRPANVLTLDEIQARENIQPVASRSSEGSCDELGAFNKLVAVLQSSGAIHEEKKRPQPQKVLPKQSYPPPPPAQSLRESSGSNNFGYLLEKELDFEERMIPPPPPPVVPAREHPTTLISRGDPPAVSLSRLQTIERMLENLDRSHAHTGPIPPTRGYGPLPPPPHAGIPSPMSVLPPSKRVTPTQREQPRPLRDKPHPHDSDGGWVYPEGILDVRQQPADMYRPSNHRQLASSNRPYQMMPSGGSGRTNANNWAVEMERRRVQELQQMQLKERMERDRLQQQHSLGHTPPQAKVGPSSRPNISLLPTSVMRHMHNSNKSTQPHADNMAKSSPSSLMANRLDQELTSKASQTHSAISSLLNHSTDVSPTMDYPSTITNAGRMRAPPPLHGHTHHMMHHVTDPTAPMMYQRYNMPSMLHGQNPYMY